MELQKKFNVILYSEAQEFLASLDEKTRNKIFQTFDRASLLLDPEVFKKLADTDIWEFRTLFNKKKYRVLSYSKDSLLNFQKFWIILKNWNILKNLNMKC